MAGCECAELSRLALHLDRMITGMRAQIAIEAGALAAEMAKPMIAAAERGAEVRIAGADCRVQRLKAELEEAHRYVWALKRENERLREAAREGASA